MFHLVKIDHTNTIATGGFFSLYGTFFSDVKFQRYLISNPNARESADGGKKNRRHQKNAPAPERGSVSARERTDDHTEYHKRFHHI